MAARGYNREKFTQRDWVLMSLLIGGFIIFIVTLWSLATDLDQELADRRKALSELTEKCQETYGDSAFALSVHDGTCELRPGVKKLPVE